MARGDNLIDVEFRDRRKVLLAIAQSGYSLRGFADKIGISQGYLSQLLKGDKTPSPTVAYKIAKGLETDVTDVFLFKVIDKSIEDNQEISV